MMKACRTTLILMLVFVLTLTTACAGKSKPVEEPDVVITPETTEEPVEKEDPEIEEEPEESTDDLIPETTEEPPEEKEPEVEGQPELIWKYEYEDDVDSIASFGEIVATGQYCVSYIHHLSDGTLLDALPHEHTVEDMDFSVDGTILAAGQGVYGVQLTELSGDSEPETLVKGFNGRLAFSPDGLYIAAGTRDGILWIWELDSLTEIATLENPDYEDMKLMEKMLLSINYHPSGKLLGAAHWDDDGTIYIWDTQKNEVIQSMQSISESGINVFQFSPNGSEIAYVVKDSGEYLVRLATVDDNETILDIGLEKQVMDMSFSPDGSLLAVASRSLPVTIWDTASGNLLYTLDQEIAPLEDTPYLDNAPDLLTFTDDGGHLAVASKWAGTIELWRLPGAKPIEPLPFDINLPPPLPSDVLFDTGSAELKDEAFVELEALAEELYAGFTKATITFIGHTDSRGDAESNLQLSIDRAQAIKDWFQNWADEKEDNEWILHVDGKGDTELKVPDVNVDGDFLNDAGSLNRRVEIEIEP